jgi:hypothetical protein
MEFTQGVFERINGYRINLGGVLISADLRRGV